MTEIISNGSKWAGEAPDGVAKLIEVLRETALDRTFEDYGNFIMPVVSEQMELFREVTNA